MSVLRIQNGQFFSSGIRNSIPWSGGRCSRYISPRSIWAVVETISTPTTTSPWGADRWTLGMAGVWGWGDEPVCAVGEAVCGSGDWGTAAPSSCLLPDEQPPRIAIRIIQRTGGTLARGGRGAPGHGTFAGWRTR